MLRSSTAVGKRREHTRHPLDWRKDAPKKHRRGENKSTTPPLALRGQGCCEAAPPRGKEENNPAPRSARARMLRSSTAEGKRREQTRPSLCEGKDAAKQHRRGEKTRTHPTPARLAQGCTEEAPPRGKQKHNPAPRTTRARMLRSGTAEGKRREQPRPSLCEGKDAAKQHRRGEKKRTNPPLALRGQG